MLLYDVVKIGVTIFCGLGRGSRFYEETGVERIFRFDGVYGGD